MLLATLSPCYAPFADTPSAFDAWAIAACRPLMLSPPPLDATIYADAAPLLRHVIDLRRLRCQDATPLRACRQMPPPLLSYATLRYAAYYAAASRL